MRERRPRRRSLRGPRARREARDPAATRARLVDAARRLFAEHGYDDVTVRDICREARANLALVNYHFGDKHGLYSDVVNEAITSLSDFNARAMQAPDGCSAEERLAHFISTFVGRLFEAARHDDWIHKLMQHEFTRPTDAAPRIAQVAIAPRLRYLASVVAELLGAPLNDPRVAQSVTSVHGLCLVYARIARKSASLKSVAPELVPSVPFDAKTTTAHVTAFALAGIRAQRTNPAGSEAA